MVVLPVEVSKHWKCYKGNSLQCKLVPRETFAQLSAKMPVNVCTIVLWLWRGEVFHNSQALWVEIITQIKHRLKNNLLSFSREIGFLLQQLNASRLNDFIHSFIQHLIWALSIQQAWCLHVLADCICTDCFPVTTHLIPSRRGQNVNMAASYRWSLFLG